MVNLQNNHKVGRADKSRGHRAPAFFVTIHEWHGKGLTIVSHSRIRANVLRSIVW